MVDALSRAREWLARDGDLVDIRPTPECARLEVCTGTTIVRAGDLREDATGTGPRTRHLQAAAAVAEALARGWFALESRREFTFLRHADTVAEMQEYAEGKWKEAHLDEETLQRAAVLLRADPAARLWLAERITISRLRPMASR
jgi:hypothetical protein